MRPASGPARQGWRRFPARRLGRLACAVCCAVPILVATGVISAGAVDGWLDAAAAVLVAAAALFVAVPLWRRQRAARASGETCDCGGRGADDGCSCRATADNIRAAVHACGQHFGHAATLTGC